MDNICSQAELRMFELFTNCSAVKQTHHLRLDSFNSSSQSFFVVKTTNYNLVRQIPFTRTENVAIGKLRTLHIQTASSLKYDTCFFLWYNFHIPSINQSSKSFHLTDWLTLEAAESYKVFPSGINFLFIFHKKTFYLFSIKKNFSNCGTRDDPVNSSPHSELKIS